MDEKERNCNIEKRDKGRRLNRERANN